MFRCPAHLSASAGSAQPGLADVHAMACLVMPAAAPKPLRYVLTAGRDVIDVSIDERRYGPVPGWALAKALPEPFDFPAWAPSSEFVVHRCVAMRTDKMALQWQGGWVVSHRKTGLRVSVPSTSMVSAIESAATRLCCRSREQYEASVARGMGYVRQRGGAVHEVNIVRQ